MIRGEFSAAGIAALRGSFKRSLSFPAKARWSRARVLLFRIDAERSAARDGIRRRTRVQQSRMMPTRFNEPLEDVT
jgi:hypothetical protein